MRTGTGWKSLSQVLFMNVVTDTAETFGREHSNFVG